MASKDLRGFSAGIILSTGILAGVYYLGESETPPALTEETVNQYLAEKGELAISEEEYTALKNADTAVVEPKEKTVEEETEKTDEEKVVEMTLTISKGMSTGEVCDLLEQGKIIKDSEEFLKYLRSNNLEGAVRAESHRVNSKMSFDELAKEITSS
jgi:hypothetical protein